MNAFVYHGALYCADCAAKIKATKGWKPFYSADSETWPRGPYPAGGGEADTPQHCGQCCVFLENPLTDEGRQYVRAAIDLHITAGRGTRHTLQDWAHFYGIPWAVQT